METRRDRGLKKVHGVMQWTCLCRYHAYEEDEDSEWYGGRPTQRRGVPDFGVEI